MGADAARGRTATGTKRRTHEKFKQYFR
jgi:hypothetical protein